MNDLDSHMMQHIDEADQGEEAATADGCSSNATDGWPEDDPTQQEPPPPPPQQPQQQPGPSADDGWGDDDGWAPAPSPPAALPTKVAEDGAAGPRSGKRGTVKKSPAKQKPKVRLKPKAKTTATAPDPPPPAPEDPDPVQRLKKELALEVARAKAELLDTRQRLEGQLAESEASKLALKEAITAKAKAKVQQVRDECAAQSSALEAKCADLEEQLVSFLVMRLRLQTASLPPIAFSYYPLVCHRRPRSWMPLPGARCSSKRSWTPRQ
jgi:chemotaxis protein histidine kinase CheA